MIEIKYLPNRFEKKDQIVKKVPYLNSKNMRYYLDRFEGIPSKVELEDYTVIYMGVTVKDLDKEYPRNNSQIIVTPLVKDPVSAFVAASWAFLTSAGFQTFVFIMATGYSIYSAVTMKNRMPTYGNDGYGMDENSPTYGWDGIAQTRTEGIPVGVIYGEHRVGGNVINEYIRTDGDKNYLHSLAALCEGEIEDITDIYVNDNPIENYDGVVTTERYGTNSQTPIPDFEDLHSLQSVNVSLTQSNPHTHTTTQDVEAFEVHLRLDSLFEQSSNGQIVAWSATYKVEYRINGSGDPWTDLGETTIYAKSTSPVRRVYRVDDLVLDTYDIRVTRTSADSDTTHFGDMLFDKVDEITTDNLSYPNTALLAVEVLATDQLSGQAPNITCVVKGKKVSIPQVMNGSVAVDWEDYYWDPDYDSGAGAFRLLSDDSVLTWDGSTFYTAYSANPIWCVQDLLINERYGLGGFIDTNLIDSDLFLQMAKYCDEKVPDGSGDYEKRFRMDVVLDSFTSSLDLISQLSSTFNAFPFYSEGTIKFKIDQPETVAQVFGMGNIIENSFTQKWKSLKEIPNVVEVTFNDKDKNYEQDTLAIADESVVNDSDVAFRKNQVRLFTTSMSQALRIGRYALKVAKYIDRVISFKAGIDAIACQVGDRIDFSHDVPQWGYSGRLSSGNTVSIVKLDKQVTIEAGKTYEVQIRHGADIIETREVTDGVGNYTSLNITPPLSDVPAEFDYYVFGEQDILSKPFRVISMERLENDEVEITAIEYNENVYDDTAVTIPESNYSALDTDIPQVENLDTTERAVETPDGTVISVIDVYWTLPDDTGNVNKYKGVKIYLSDDNGNSWSYVGYSEGIKFTINDNIDAATYLVKAVTVCKSGFEDTLSNAPQDSITITGSGVTPDIVANFAYTWGDKLTLKWSPNDELSLAGYEIRDNNTNWGVDDANLIYRGLATTKVLEPTTRSVGTFYIRAFNRAQTYSTTSASITPTNSAPSQPSNFDVDVLFNVARIYWDDVADVDVKYYEVYKSETNAWAGEEELVAEVSGRQCNFKGRASQGGEIDSATTTEIVDDNLIGLADDYLNGDLLQITSGDNEGDEVVITDFDGTTGTITVAGWGVATPSAGDTYMIHNRVYVKVRGYDNYGAGTLTDAVAVQFEGIDENMIEDNIITARKIYVECLSALSANIGCVTAGTLEGTTFQTAAAGARIVMDATSLRSYDSGCNLMYELCDGHVTAKSMTLVDPNCACCYSYLSAGAWYFHDELGNETPYVKRICSGVACTGDTICLCGWCTSPLVMVGINSLNSFDDGYAGQTQKWIIGNSTPAFYCNSSTDYGYCFDVNACLVLAAAQGSEVVKSAAFEATVCTCTNICFSCASMKFKLWCNAACANYYYGTICYALCYRKSGDATWCACCFSYTQPHASVVQMQTVNTVCVPLLFPCSETWEICAHQVSLNWADSGFSSATVNCAVCCRSLTACTVNQSQTWCCCQTCTCRYYNCTCEVSDTISVAGSKPANTFCTLLTYCVQDYSNCVYAYLWHDTPSIGCNCTCVRFQTDFGSNIYTGGGASNSASCCGIDVTCTDYGNWASGSTRDLSTYNACAFSSFAIKSCFRSCWRQCSIGFMRYCHVGSSQVCLVSGTLCHCYCTVSGSACCVTDKCLHSLTDTFGTQTVLDPDGCLNWLAVGFF